MSYRSWASSIRHLNTRFEIVNAPAKVPETQIEIIYTCNQVPDPPVLYLGYSPDSGNNEDPYIRQGDFKKNVVHALRLLKWRYFVNQGGVTPDSAAGATAAFCRRAGCPACHISAHITGRPA